MGGDPKHKLALSGDSWNDCRPARLPPLIGELGKIEAEVALGSVQPMTSEATLGKNGTNLPIEINFSKDERSLTKNENKGEEKSLYVLHLERLEYS